ncbi:SH3 domain-containing protein [Eubacteriales bacterium OttesenSCG-928-K08]|nr:SH3 domain-containing protein [Eubacteriales bacterium OttesenSCG-928-K08]
MKPTRTGSRVVALAICLAVLLSAAPALAANVAAYAMVTATTANVYSDTAKTNLIGTFSKGDILAIESQTSDGTLYKVRQGPNTTETGYVAKADLGNASGGISSSKTVATIKKADGSAPSTGTGTGTAGVIANCKSYVNFRKTADAKGSKLGTLKLGTALTVLGEENGFYKVTANGVTGYVSKDYVKITSTSTPSTGDGVTAASGSGTINASSTRMYKEASTTSARVATLAKNTEVTITGESGSFYKIKASSKEGFVAKTAVTLDPVVTDASGSGTINASAKLYKKASTSSGSITTLTKNTAVTITGTSGSFYRVKTSSREGFVEQKYVTTSGSTPGSSTPTTGGTDTGKITVGTGGINVTGGTGTLSTTAKNGLAAAKKLNSDTIGYINISGTNVQQPILFKKGNVFYYSSYNINKKKDSKGSVHAFYSEMTRNSTITAHNMRTSGTMFHELHHIYDKTMGYSSCQTTDAKCANKNWSTAPNLKTGSRTFEVSLHGYTKWEVWAMYKVEKNEPTSTLNYNIQHLSSSTPAQVKTWIEYQKGRSDIKFNTAVSTDDMFLTIYTCGTNFDSANAQSRLYFFLKAVK